MLFKDEFGGVVLIVQISIQEFVMLLKELSLYQPPADEENILVKLQNITTKVTEKSPPILKYLKVSCYFVAYF